MHVRFLVSKSINNYEQPSKQCKLVEYPRLFLTKEKREHEIVCNFSFFVIPHDNDLNAYSIFHSISGEGLFS